MVHIHAYFTVKSAVFIIFGLTQELTFLSRNSCGLLFSRKNGQNREKLTGRMGNFEIIEY
jgi:hypothetical protein